MATAYTPQVYTTTEWFASSGFTDEEPSTANGYAQRLIRYIRDPSTVRARVMDRFSSAPPIENIRQWRSDWERLVEHRKSMRAPEEFQEEAGLSSDIPDEDPDEVFAQLAAHIVVDPFTLPVPAAPAPAAEFAPPGRSMDDEPINTSARNHREVIERCARRFDLTAEALLGGSRKRPIARVRQFTAAVLRARGNSYPQVGRYLNDMDHSTVIHAVRATFFVNMRDPAFVTAWMAEAPCVTKFARSPQELDMLMGVRG
ncbi:helix-turn-helix domain-containing protein [Novosphingobium resinovorum]|uniref:Chromosomal replication initiator DnaA C-terminal domain-containing protein n=1 Tax=Novosphingobium resinovorum TaxID=158500 RepID=A0A1D8A518_9SPHN|nr:helix-turn-helix domain-containing protein [Novosphingobium resinovorum]AOR77205.1 hypothetical protein BES08_10925 [Novosphingobium resinovorum]